MGETLRLVGCYDDWPAGRGIYINEEKNHGKGKDGVFIIWVGEEDQLRIMAMNKGSDVQAVWDLFYTGVQSVHEAITAMKEQPLRPGSALSSQALEELVRHPTLLDCVRGTMATVHKRHKARRDPLALDPRDRHEALEEYRVLV